MRAKKACHQLVLPLVLLLSTLACQGLSTPGPMPTLLPLVGVEALQFSDAQTGERFRALDACIQEVAAEGWRTTGYQIIGNSYESRWCTGAGTRDDCQIASGSADDRDQRVITLETYLYQDRYPEVFGLGVNVLWNPAEDGWGASFYFSEDGGGIYSENASIGFSRYESGRREPTEQVSIIGPFSYAVLETGVYASDSSNLSEREKLTLALSSPEAMRDMALGYYADLAAEVEAALRSGAITACDRGEYRNDGIQPACTPRPLTPDELSAELERAEVYFAHQQSLLQSNYEEMYLALYRAFPFDRCWP